MRQGVVSGAIWIIALATWAPASLAGPPRPPGGHIPVYFGGANQGDYPPSTTTVGESTPSAVRSLSVVSSAPNPFRGATTIRFTLARDVEARLRIFDLAGRQVREHVLRATEAGMQGLAWDGRDENGKPLGSGVYFYQVRAGEKTVTKKLVLLR